MITPDPTLCRGRDGACSGTLKKRRKKGSLYSGLLRRLVEPFTPTLTTAGVTFLSSGDNVGRPPLVGSSAGHCAIATVDVIASTRTDHVRMAVRLIRWLVCVDIVVSLSNSLRRFVFFWVEINSIT